MGFPAPRRRVRIAATSSFVPDRVLSNQDLEKKVDTTDEWIVQRTGIRERRLSGPDEFPSDLGARAVSKLLQKASLDPKEVDLIVCATSFPDYLFPATACLIQNKTGCVNAGAFDLNTACTGFLYALSAGWKFVESGSHRNVVVLGTETLSKMTNYKDRSTCILFGDGAGAVLLQPSDDEGEILHCELRADGSQAERVWLPGGGARLPAHKMDGDPTPYYIHMDGRAVYKFAVNRFVELTRNAARSCGVDVTDISLLIPHQVNLRIIESAVERLGFPMSRVWVNIQRYGNTSTASIPVGLDEAVREGRIQRGDLVVLVAFGGGLTWASCALRY